jgi:hypothetical protein
MKRHTVVLITMIAVLSLAFAGWGLAQTKLAPKGDAVWDFLKKADYAKKWKMWPDSKPLHKGVDPHGALLNVYVNAAALKGIAAKKGKLPVDAMVVIDNFTADKKLAFIGVMYKVKGYNPTDGDWFWAQYAPDGKVIEEGKIDECIRCHAAQKTNDYVYSSKLK